MFCYNAKIFLGSFESRKVYEKGWLAKTIDPVITHNEVYMTLIKNNFYCLINTLSKTILFFFVYFFFIYGK